MLLRGSYFTVWDCSGGEFAAVSLAGSKRDGGLMCRLDFRAHPLTCSRGLDLLLMVLAPAALHLTFMSMLYSNLHLANTDVAYHQLSYFHYREWPVGHSNLAYNENVCAAFAGLCSSKWTEAVSWLAFLQTLLSSATQRAHGSMDGWHITPTPKTVPWWMAPIMAMTFLCVAHSKAFCWSVYLPVSFTHSLSEILRLPSPSSLFISFFPCNFLTVATSCEPCFA